jgi:hypothetical protein
VPVRRAAGVALESGDEGTALALLCDLLVGGGLEPATVTRIAAKMPLGAHIGADRYPDIVSSLRATVDTPGLGEEVEADLRFQLSRVRLATGDYGGGAMECRRALPHLGHDPVAKQWAPLVLAWRGSSFPVAQRRQWVRQAAAVRVPALDPAERLRRLGDRVSALLTLGDPYGWELAARLPDTMDSAAERLQATRVAANLADHAMVWGRYDEARGRLDAALELVDRHGYLGMRPFLLTTRAHLDWFTGAWSGLVDRVREQTTDRDLDAIARLEAVLVAGVLQAVTGRPGAAQGLHDGMVEVRQHGATEQSLEFAAALASVYLREGDTGRALWATDTAAADLRRTGSWLWGADLVPVRLRALLAANRDSEAARLVAAFARGMSGRGAPAPMAALATCRAMLSAARAGAGEPAGSAEGSRIRYRRAARSYAVAASAWQALPRPYDATLAQEEQARCLIAAGDTADGTALLARVNEGLCGLGATMDADRVAFHLRELGVTVARPWRGGRRGYGADLSPRELDVVRLVAAGRTNREIADALHRSQNTVGTQRIRTPGPPLPSGSSWARSRETAVCTVERADGGASPSQSRSIRYSTDTALPCWSSSTPSRQRSRRRANSTRLPACSTSSRPSSRNSTVASRSLKSTTF